MSQVDFSYLKKIFIPLLMGLLYFSACNSAQKGDTPAFHAKTTAADVVVYGDASGGVIAAVQAARMGKNVTLISQFGHLGGLSSSGLGATDMGDVRIIGGMSKEFYHRIYLYYLKDEAWQTQTRQDFPRRNPKQGGGNPNTIENQQQLASCFEPKVAERIFNQLFAESGVHIIKGRIDLKDGITMNDKRIITIQLEDGQRIEGNMFIDASYEGDLMALANVSFMIGREANAEFGEDHNGNTGPLKTNNLPDGIDPYLVKGDPNSGLIPDVNPDMGGKVGDADYRLQAFCYRMVLTDAEANRIAIEKPANYEEARYEILFRAIEAGQSRNFFKVTPMPNNKTDSNNLGGISTDYIGMNYGKDWNWSTLNHKQRDALAAKHKDWQLGLVWTLQNHSRVPESIRQSVAQWGLPKDEFADNGNWPYNLYVREARRMKSDFIMTEQHCRNLLPVTESIGMGAYTLDSHNTQRFVYNGMVKNEGDIQARLTAPYAISYRAIIPKASECENLLVPWALSSTHIAFGSIRMEPVFMIIGQSAGTAAVMAIDGNTSVQDVPYAKLREQLIKDGQVLKI